MEFLLGVSGGNMLQKCNSKMNVFVQQKMEWCDLKIDIS